MYKFIDYIILKNLNFLLLFDFKIIFIIKYY